MLDIDLVLVCDLIMHESVLLLKDFGHRGRLIILCRLFGVFIGDPPVKKVSASLFGVKNRIHILSVTLICPIQKKSLSIRFPIWLLLHSVHNFDFAIGIFIVEPLDHVMLLEVHTIRFFQR
jgi:hypothetical protein